MMRGARAVLVLLLAAAGCFLGWAILGQLVRAEPARRIQLSTIPRHIPATSGLDSLVTQAAARPAFRPDRRPAPVRSDPAQGQAPEAPPPTPVPRPQLAVSGILWGPEPAAIVEGIPGTEGSTVLRQGSALAGIRAVRIGRERVVLVGFDTSWTLPVRQPWR